jgi:lysophospholipase L1-like esterase
MGAHSRVSRLVALATTVVTLLSGAVAAADPQTAEQADVERLRSDWAQLLRYRDENRRLPPPSAARPRVVFLGDSLTEGWSLAGLKLDALEVLNRGIGGQTTPQLLVRFRQDVVELKPAVVHILAGTNDLAGNTGPTTVEALESILSSMVEIAAANHITVVLASVLPAVDYPWRTGLEPAGKIAALNDWMRTYARQRKLVYADYYSALVDPHGGFKSALADDGVHPNRAGYDAMSPIAAEAILHALKAAR